MSADRWDDDTLDYEEIHGAQGPTSLSNEWGKGFIDLTVYLFWVAVVVVLTGGALYSVVKFVKWAWEA